MSTTVILIIAVAITLVISIPLSIFLSLNKYKKDSNNKLGDAQKRADQIIDDAIRAGEAKKREALLEIKEESFRTKNELEKELKERRAEVQKLEQRNLNKEEALDKKVTELEIKENKLNQDKERLRQKEAEVDEARDKHLKELERISNLTKEEAKKLLLSELESEVEHEKAVIVKNAEIKAKDEADETAKQIIINAVQRCAPDFVQDITVSTVELPNDEVKGRIIGREGRNIRAIENATGVELIVDDTPEAVVVSSFDPLRREVAKRTLEKLINDGRIQPGRIEETAQKMEKEVDNFAKEKGKDAVISLGVNGVHPELVRLLGKMYFRRSYGQNVLKHSIEVAEISALLAAEMGEDPILAKRAGLLHDIGKSIDQYVEKTHVQAGSDLARKYKENDVVINTIESHHLDTQPTSIIACIVQAADAISAARPGARRESIENYITRLKQLEEIANDFEGVDKTYAIQAGREVRVIVSPEKISDDKMVLLARDIAKKIENDMVYPGQITVNVIRETRKQEIAK